MYIACFWSPRIGIAAEKARPVPQTDETLLALVDDDGIVKACALETAIYGVKTGQTAAAARGLCSDLVTLPYDRPTYDKAAQLIWDEMSIESDIVEPVLPELCYAEMPESLDDIVPRLRLRAATMAAGIGAEVFVGVGRSKFVARLAAQLERPDEVVTVRIGDEAQFLSSLPIADLPKVDPKTCRQLQKVGVNTLGDAARLSSGSLPASLHAFGRQLQQWRQGFDADPVRAAWPARTSAAQITFDSEEDNLLVVEKALFQMAERIAVDLAKTHAYCRELTLKVTFEGGAVFCETSRLALPEARAAAIQRAALRLMHRMTIQKPIATLEVIVSDLGAGSGVQLSLLDLAGELPMERKKRLESSLEHLRQRYGLEAIVRFCALAKARKIHNWMSPLSYRLLETLPQVSTDALGEPFSYRRILKMPGSQRAREERLYRIVRVHNRWRESGKLHGEIVDAEVWRVETEPFAVCELRRIESDWCLTGAWD